MKTVQIYDKPMCCSTGVCGPEVDPVLPQFAADLDWLKSQGHHVERYNLAQQPQAFIENKAIHQVLSTEGTESLPVVVIDGEIVSRKVYPTRDALSDLVSGSPAKQLLPVVKSQRRMLWLHRLLLRCMFFCPLIFFVRSGYLTKN